MTIFVDIQGTGQVAEFPDGTPPEVITQALQQFSTQAPAQQDFQLTPSGAPTTLSRFVEPALTAVTGALAEPLAGVAGTIQALNPFADPGAGAEAVAATRQALTAQPRTEAGQEALQAVGDVIEPVAQALTSAEQTLGETTLEATGSPALAAAAATIPTALLELTGLASAKGITKLKSGRALDTAIKEAAPSTEQLFTAGRQIFKEVDNLGGTVKPEALAALTRQIEVAAKNVGGSRRTTPSSFGVIDDFKEIVDRGAEIGVDELDQLRTVASNAAKTIDPAQKAPALAIIDKIDDFLDRPNETILNIPKDAPNIGQEWRAGRNIWGRARKSEMLEEAFTAAQDTQSGFENGIRIEFRKIRKNKRKSKFFTKRELEALRQVSEGTKSANLAKLIGRLGFSEGQAINFVNPAIAGSIAGSAFGAPAAIAVVGIGQVSKQLAQKLTKAKGRLAQQVVRAGSNAEEITKAYLRNTPKAQRSAVELSELLTRNQVDLSTAKSAFARDAADVARQIRAAQVGALAGGEVAALGGEQ